MTNTINLLCEIIKKKGEDVEAWIAEQYRAAQPFFYSSVDLRHSVVKLAPVDMNLFPAGFNVLSSEAIEAATTEVAAFFAQRYPDAEKVLLVPERHTRNLNYLENVAILRDAIAAAGFEVRLGGIDPEQDGAITVESSSGKELVVEHVCRDEGVDGAKDYVRTCSGFRPDVVIVNNDLTAGSPALFRDIVQPVEPPLGMGWYRRRKWVHFAAYEDISGQFSREFGIDPWLIGAEFQQCGMINFKENRGIECVALAVEKVLHATKTKYKEYGIKDTPYAFIKADSGTYGMGIMTVTSGDEVMAMNKKSRNKMNVIKEGTGNSEVIVQEGVPTVDTVGGNPAEPMLYLVNGKPIGGAFRVNDERDSTSSLNATGMRFIPMSDAKGQNIDAAQDGVCNFKVYGLIATLSSIAATREVYDDYAI